jgi:hypothetical protein
VLLVGLAVPVASAAPDAHTTQVGFLPGEEVVQVPTGEHVRIVGGWATFTEEQREHFMATVIVSIHRDGLSQQIAAPLLFVIDAVPGLHPDLYVVEYSVEVKPGKPNDPQVWTLTFEFTEDHSDGVITVPASEVLTANRALVWTPRGHFPSADYPCPNGADPCVDY